MKPGQCKHYTGCLNPNSPACAAGINYREHVGGPGLGWVKRLPCFTLENHGPAEEVVPCAHYLEPTAEELAADEAKISAAFARTMVAYSGKVREWRKAQNWSKTNRVAAQGSVPCEACGTGRIHLSMSAYNGHVWGKCSTEGCVSWME